MFKKIDIYYTDANKKVHYLHSTNSYKLVRDAVQGAKIFLTHGNYAKVYAKTYANKVGEEIVLNRIFGRKAKQE